MDEFDLFTGTKQGREAKDGSETTIIFYDLSNQNLIDDVRMIAMGPGMDDIPWFGNKDFYEAKEVNDRVKNSVKEVTNEYEKISNIRFFNINNLQEDDLEFLENSGVKIPKKADIIYREVKMKHDLNYAGTGQHPDGSEKPEYVSLDKKFTERVDTYFSGLKHLVHHETLHSLGFKHPHDCKDYPKEYDHIRNTNLSYKGPRSYAGIREVDEFNLTKAYGKNPEYEYKGLDLKNLKKVENNYFFEVHDYEEVMNFDKSKITDVEQIFFDKMEKRLKKSGNELTNDEKRILTQLSLTFNDHDVRFPHQHYKSKDGQQALLDLALENEAKLDTKSDCTNVEKKR